ncbi:uncharacterized protein BT62DRAFT_996214 [Guyanagaster necrorhizus]|uniref:Integral membrane protein n=1 Tax=Guyanagaster necrorhizus TaxID=856835 RepID=A0A9P8APR6_9AGAR|nr:uncharacterized protein BT62DRAFT_996214 [Guyanagaster necrorhizus MCA 3950]KAG7443061.1 hypothetical protein BT62DRAFT_996214 [Guyanagaster necrorhizus MCA 3950]
MSSSLDLPASLDLPPHLSAHKYFFVCTLTVAAWDTLVLSPRTWKLFRTPEWPVLKILFHFMRLFMPIEFTIVGVAFFDTNFSTSSCEKFYLFEPICTAILLAAASAVHVLRIQAIYEKSRAVLFGMGALFAMQVIVTAVCCGFYRAVPLEPGQGCIAGIKHNWVGIYWVFPTLLYTVSLALALLRSVKSLQAKPLSPWRLMLRDGLNLYGAIWIVNMTNMLFLFIMKPTGENDPVKTIITSMAAVLTTSMTLRIILNVRGTLHQGGTFVMGSTTHTSSRTTHVISTRSGVPTNISRAPHTYTLDELRTKPEGEWTDSDNRSSVKENKESLINSQTPAVKDDGNVGVKITVDREVGYDMHAHAK